MAITFSIILISLGVFFILKYISLAKKRSENVVIKNKYIEIHEKKIVDDKEYNEYLEWCKMKGEIAVDKEGYDEHRMKEYLMYRKLVKYGIRGLKQ